MAYRSSFGFSIKQVRVLAEAFGITRAPAYVQVRVATIDPAQLHKPLHERTEASAPLRIVLAHIHQHTDPPHPFRLLRARRERPCHRRTAEQCDELATLHSFTSG
jgi:hypothetical protein